MAAMIGAKDSFGPAGHLWGLERQIQRERERESERQEGSDEWMDNDAR